MGGTMNPTHGVTHYSPDSCYGCKLRSLQYGRPTFTPHFNHSVGQFVTSPQDFANALKKAGDLQSERSGVFSSYEAIHPSDLVANRPAESAPNHLSRLSKIDEDPTITEHVARLRAERDRHNAAAREAARTKDIIDHDHEDHDPEMADD